MKNNKKTILFITSIISFVIIANYFVEPVERDEVGTNLVVSSKEEGYIKSLSIGSLDPVEGINWYGGTDPDHYSLGGVIRNIDIKTVQVFVNEQMHETNMIKINDDMSVWYCIFEYKRKSILEEPDKMKIEAFDEKGTILWEEAFDSILGG
ncbi:hypothetical protein GMD78_05810 [Ornithinibacillus sp. L9]|uniref:Uncharacterized protein n=1 Tax=Ornithinibacillus caprae TaxID=2678566 RepID=A0A6N8FEG6_9BACI|nr:hypothetical protein [Ornithinibacillus caprae]MUK87913.1 hypothetical protein [Ornithinibacillus caprae]